MNDPRGSAARTAIGYAVFAGAWIFLSDAVATALVRDPHTLETVSVVKGWVFVAVTAGLLYLRVRDQLTRWSAEVERRQHSEAQLRRISRAVEQSPASVVVTDPHGVIEYVNEKFTKVSGHTREEAIGQHTRLLKSGQTPPEVYAALWQTITAGGEWRGELLNRRKNGELFWEFASMSPIVDADGTITNFLAVKEDITERKALADQLRQSQKLEAIGTLAGGIAHDFNNLLTVILGGASLQLEPNATQADQLELAYEIKQAADRAASLTRQLLLFSRKHPVQRARVDVNGLVTNVGGLLRRVIGANIVMETRCAATVPPVCADTGLLELVLMNLAVNARDAMPHGGRLVIDTAALDVAAGDAVAPAGTRPGAYAVVRVTDTGTGIPPSVLPHIFEPFYTTKDVGKGTGLGLSTVYGIVRQHDGWISVQTADGQGTTFTIGLPVITEPDEAKTGDARAGETTRGHERVMLVDDDAPVRRMTASILRRAGYDIVEAGSAEQALRVWGTGDSRVQLLLTDLFLPGEMSGLDLATALVARHAPLRVLYTSGLRERFESPDVPLEPGRNFLPKPFDAAALLMAVRQRLDSDAISRS